MRKVMDATIILSAVDRMSKTVNAAYGNAQRRLDEVNRSSARIARNSASFARQAAAPAVGIGLALAVPIKKAIQFEQAIANVGAVARASDADLAKMTAQARKMGATTQFTAVQSAEAMEFLAMAGFNAQQTIAALPATLSLAAAGNTELATTADIASNILSGFNLQAEELSRVGDVLTNTFTTSNTTLGMLGETMKFAAPIAAGLGIDINTVAAMAGKLGDAGIQGQMAGTALRSSMLRLSAPVAKASRSLAEIGVQTKDAEGNLKPLPDLLAQIGAKVAKLPTGKQAEIIKNIFGTEAASAATVLLNQARTGSLQEYIGTLSKAGTAEATAAARMATSQGELLKLQSAAEDLAITVGNVFLPILTDLAKGASEVAARLSAWSAANPGLLKTIVKVTAAAGAILGVMASVGFVISGVATTVSTLATVFSFVGTVIAAVAGAIGAVPLAIGAALVGAGVLIYKNWEKIKSFFGRALNWIKETGSKIPEMLANGIKASIMMPYNLAKSMVQKVRNLLPFSPAKDGPLRDLDKIKLVETIAATIKPAPLVNATSNALSSFAGLSSPRPQASAASGSSISYSPVINISGPVSEQERSSFAEQLRTHSAELERMMKGIHQDKLRVSY